MMRSGCHPRTDQSMRREMGEGELMAVELYLKRKGEVIEPQCSGCRSPGARCAS